MKFILGLLIIALNSSLASAETYTCVLSGNETHTSKFPCDPAHIDRFSLRLNQLSSEARELNADREAVEAWYVFAVAACEERSLPMTPEQLGETVEPFFSREMYAAMARAAREIVCPELSSATPTAK